jgi:hypothetical protein
MVKTVPATRGTCAFLRTGHHKLTGLSLFSPLLHLLACLICHKHCLIKGLGAKSNANYQVKKHPATRMAREAV